MFEFEPQLLPERDDLEPYGRLSKKRVIVIAALKDDLCYSAYQVAKSMRGLTKKEFNLEKSCFHTFAQKRGIKEYYDKRKAGKLFNYWRGFTWKGEISENSYIWVKELFDHLVNLRDHNRDLGLHTRFFCNNEARISVDTEALKSNTQRTSGHFSISVNINNPQSMITNEKHVSINRLGQSLQLNLAREALHSKPRVFISDNQGQISIRYLLPALVPKIVAPDPLLVSKERFLSSRMNNNNGAKSQGISSQAKITAEVECQQDVERQEVEIELGCQPEETKDSITATVEDEKCQNSSTNTFFFVFKTALFLFFGLGYYIFLLNDDSKIKSLVPNQLVNKTIEEFLTDEAAEIQVFNGRNIKRLYSYEIYLTGWKTSKLKLYSSSMNDPSFMFLLSPLVAF